MSNESLSEAFITGPNPSEGFHGYRLIVQINRAMQAPYRSLYVEGISSDEEAVRIAQDHTFKEYGTIVRKFSRTYPDNSFNPNADIDF